MKRIDYTTPRPQAIIIRKLSYVFHRNRITCREFLVSGLSRSLERLPSIEMEFSVPVTIWLVDILACTPREITENKIEDDIVEISLDFVVKVSSYDKFIC